MSQQNTNPAEKVTENNLTGPRYWKSLDDLVQTPAFEEWLHREFPQGAAEANGLNRREFLKIMGASFALAGFGMSGCRRPEIKIVPYSKQPENMIPGVPKYFASSMPGAVDNIPLSVETHMARPTKIEGNANYAPYGGATTTFAQASVLDLYDPDRAQKSVRFDANRSQQALSQSAVRDLLREVQDKYAENEGEGLGVLLESSTSPSRERLVEQLKQKYPKAIIAEYEPTDPHANERATQSLYGKRLRPQYHFDKAQRVLALDTDFTGCHGSNLAWQRGFAKGRRVYNQEEAVHMSRLYMVESGFTITGGMADHRLRLPTSNIPAFLAGLAVEILQQQSPSSSLLAPLREKAQALDFEDKKEWLHACAQDLIEHKGRALIVPGMHLPEEAQQLAYYLNEVLGAVGNTIEYLNAPVPQSEGIEKLAEHMREDAIDTLFIDGGNPAYNAPADLEWEKLQRKVPQVIRYGLSIDETSKAASVHVSATHYLESWSDGRTYDGTVLPVQPMIMPLFESFMELEVLARLLGQETTDAYEITKQTFTSRVLSSDVMRDFNGYLERGYLPNSRFAPVRPELNAAALSESVKRLPVQANHFSASDLELRLVPSTQVYDGRYNNNGWLQEVPEPMNKTCWENTINISPRLAQNLGFDPETVRWRPVSAVNANTHKEGRQHAPIGKLTVDGKSIEGPVNIQPGLANYSVSVPLGFGRRVVGRVGQGTGFDAYPLFTAGSGGTRTGAKLELTGETMPVANTQQHWSMEGRAIIREANNQHYQKHPEFADHMGMEAHSPAIYGKDEDKSLAYKATQQPRGGGAYKTPEFSGPQQWGLSIDLNTCTGCNQCVIACQSENNIPIVGKGQVLEGREMHWIRLDRYYSSGNIEENKHHIPEDPQVSLQPMACQQCENAPCEQVCPVNATVHDDQGLNVMAYNRCVGTRYCANNCPYKVRRFNFFDWNKRAADHYYEGPLGPNEYETQGGKLHEMQRNPDVTVRMRGVMEKCTYCQQRIQNAKINQKSKAQNSDDIKVPDGVIKTACQQACPTDAIAFGDIADETTEVSKIKQSDRDYSVLGYLNTRPRTTYLARLRNPNSHMPDYKKMPLSQMEYEQTAGDGGDHGSGDDHGNQGENGAHDKHEGASSGKHGDSHSLRNGNHNEHKTHA